MTFRKSLLACAISAAVAAISVNAFACSTVIVGKSVSATGHIIVGHNEDNGGRIFNPQYYVPPAKHKAGEMITYEPTAAKIPQVAKTLGFVHPITGEQLRFDSELPDYFTHFLATLRRKNT